MCVQSFAPRWLWGVALILIGLGCGSEPTEPRDSGTRIAAVAVPIGDTISARTTAGDTLLLFRFAVAEAMEIAVFASASVAPLTLTLSDSASGHGITGLYVEPQLQLLERRTLIVPVTGAKTYLISVRPLTQPVAQDFRFMIYRVNRAPEHHESALALEEPVANETLETSADIDEFTIQGPAGQELIGFLQALDPSLPGVARLTVGLSPPPFSGFPFVQAGAGDPEAAATGRFVLPSSEAVRVTLQADSPTWMPGGTQAGLVRFAFRAIDRKPEQGGAVVAVGDTVDAGSIDFVGDVDQYTVSALPGSELNVFLQALNDTATTLLTLTLAPARVGQPFVQSRGTDGNLTRQATGRFSVPPEGQVTLEVAGASDVGGLHRGAYRFFVYPINRAPEIAGAVLTLGQPVEGETIELPGDVDEFVLTAPATTLANLVLSGPAEAAGFIRLELTDRSSGARLLDLPLFDPLQQPNAAVISGNGTFTLPSGSYKLLVEGQNSTGDAYRGSYGAQTLDLDSLPESAPQSLSIAAGPVSEDLSPLGDRDVFSFSGTAGDLLDLTLAATAADEAPGFEAFIQPVTIHGPFAGAFASGRTEPLGRSGRFELPASGI